MAMNIIKISRPKISRLVGFSFVFLAILALPLLLGGQTIFETNALMVINTIIIYLVVAAVLSFHYTVVPLKYNLKLFLSTGIGVGFILPFFLGGYGVFLMIFTIPIFGLITTLGPKLQDLLDRLSRPAHYLLLLPSTTIIVFFVLKAIIYLIVNGYFAIN